MFSTLLVLHVQALEAIARPFPALFCVCLVSEVLREAAQSAKSSICRSLGWDRQAASPTLAELANNRTATAADVLCARSLEGKACLFKAAAMAQQCFSATAAVQVLVTHQHNPLGMQLHNSNLTEANSRTCNNRQQQQLPLGLPFGYLSPHVHQHTRHLQPAGNLHHASTVKQALLAGQSPFALFAGQPSTETWLKLMQALQAQNEEDSVLDHPHSILLTRRASAGSIARQQAVMYRATIQQQRPSTA